jgi:hypothetical protein
LYRILRALAAAGIFQETVEPPRFALSALSEHLRSDHPRSLRGFVLARGHDMYWKAWGALPLAVRTGQAAFELAHGASHFDYLERNPEIARIFNNGMRSLSGQISEAVAEAYDFSRVRTVIDVGGGQGALLASILRAHPHLRGMLLDLPAAISQSEDVLRAAGVAGRCERVARSFFENVPAGADAAILSRILHNWSDEESLTILRNCREALPQNGKLLVIEYVITDDAAGVPAKLFDLQMLVYFGRARERSAREYRELFSLAGFSLSRIIATSMGIAIVEGTGS